MTRLLAIICLIACIAGCETAPNAVTAKVAFSQPLLIPIQYHGKELYQNVRDWTVTVNGHDFVIRAGRVVDGASVPRLCWFFMPPDGLHRAGAFFHDEGYELRGHFPNGVEMTKDEVDTAFYNLMREAGVSKPRAGIAYQGVHLFGHPAWDSIEEPLILPVESQSMTASHFTPKRTMFSHIFAP